MDKKTLIIGGGGFVGKHIFDDLCSNHVVARVLDKTHNGQSNVSQREFLQENVAKLNVISDALDSIENVIYVASSTVPSTADPYGKVELSANIEPLINFIQCIDGSNVKHVTYISSGGTVYGDDNSSPLCETSPLSPNSMYGAGKCASEAFLQSASSSLNFKLCILRLANVYGPRSISSNHMGLINTVLFKMALGMPITIYAHIQTERDYIHVYDVAKLARKVIKQHTVGIYNVGTGEANSIKNILKIASETSGIIPQVKLINQIYQKPTKNVLDISLVRNQLGWKPSISLEEGISSLWYYYLKEKI